MSSRETDTDSAESHEAHRPTAKQIAEMRERMHASREAVANGTARPFEQMLEEVFGN